MPDEKKGLFKRIFGGGKNSCCSSVQIVEIDEKDGEKIEREEIKGEEK